MNDITERRGATTSAVHDAHSVRLEWKSTLIEQERVDISPGDWLAELREFRGRVAWAGGRRPGFRRSDGTFHDAEESDLAAHHLILREEVTGSVVGCVRYAPLDELRDSSNIRSLDPILAADLLRTLGCSDSEVLEGGRLIVDPAWQRHGLATRLLVAGTALARICGKRLIWGTAGTRQRQEEVFLRLGYRRAASTLVPAPHLDEDLSIIVCEPDAIPQVVGMDVTRLARELAEGYGRAA